MNLEVSIPKIKNVINKIFTFFICIIIIMSSIIIGTPIKENTRIITYISATIFFVYIILYKYVMKEKIRKIYKSINLLDIFIFILCISSFIPIIFKTYVNFNESINRAIRYITVLIVYYFIKILVNEDYKAKEYIVFTIIISGIISALIGIDNITIRYITQKLTYIGVPIFQNDENRLIGNFGYANSFAINLVIPLILSIDKYSKKDKENILLLFANFIFITCIILSYSRATCIIFILMLCEYCIKQKNAKNNIRIITSVFVSVIFGMIYSKIFTMLYQDTNYLLIFGAFILLTIITIIVIIAINKIISKKEINVKKCIILLLSLIGITSIIIIIGMQLGKPLEIFKNETQTEMITYEIKNIKPSTKYKFSFNIDAQAKNGMYIYSIIIYQQNDRDEYIDQKEMRFGRYNGEKVIEIDTKENADKCTIIFKPNYPEFQEGLKVNSLNINGKEFKLDYVYLPYRVVNRIQSLNILNLLKQGRIIYYKDAFKLIKENPFTGIGGNGWRYKYIPVRSYDYYTQEVHSYPIQIFLEFGIVSIIAYILIIIMILKYYNKKSNKELVGIYIALFAILLHSTIDFDLSFFHILLQAFILMGVISASDINKIKDD